MRLATRTHLCFLGALAVVGGSLAFAPQPSSVRRISTSKRPQSQLHFFGRNQKDDDDEKKQDDKEETEDKPFFARFFERMQPTEEAVKPATNETTPPAMMTTKEEPVKVVETKKAEPPKKKEQTPMEQAQALKAQAERMRLEADKLDAKLTLDKIERLENELKQAKRKDESVEELQREMEALQAKMRGEAPKPRVVSSPKKEESPSVTVASTPSPETTTSMTSTTDAQPLNKEKFQEALKDYEEAPEFMKYIIAGAVGMYSPNIEELNATEVALRTEMMERSDYSFLKDVPEPVFSQEEIEKTKSFPLFRAAVMAKQEKSEDDVALDLLKDQYYSQAMSKSLESSIQENPFLDIESVFNMTELDRMAESLFPKACRKEGETPTLAQANMLVTDVLPQAGFNPSGKPEPLEGGFIIRGTNKLDSGDGLVESIDTALQKSPIAGTMSVFFINDFTVFTDEQMETNFDPGNADPILLVTGPKVYREPRRLLYSAVSSFGIASSWYLSIYPFLLNPDLMKRAEEQMSLADSNMAYDLTWLTDLSLPLFLTFMGIQLTHEIGHRAVALAYGVSLCGFVLSSTARVAMF